MTSHLYTTCNSQWYKVILAVTETPSSNYCFICEVKISDMKNLVEIKVNASEENSQDGYFSIAYAY